MERCPLRPLVATFFGVPAPELGLDLSAAPGKRGEAIDRFGVGEEGNGIVCCCDICPIREC